jgi:hypothetical protein
MESICRFGSCYLHQNKFPGRSVSDIHNIAFAVFVVVAVVAIGVVVAAAAAD